MTKSIQLYDVTVLRHGLMTVGPTGGGKTMCKNMLANALTKLNKERGEYYEVRQLNMNPKSITMGQLYGSFDDATHEWSDGILCKLFREAVYDTVERQKWVVFDGPVDALWIESMNTVLDENKKLCLVSGEIITMTGWMRMVFEVEVCYPPRAYHTDKNTHTHTHTHTRLTWPLPYLPPIHIIPSGLARSPTKACAPSHTYKSPPRTCPWPPRRR
jgi:hypothetical protein